MIGLIVSCAAAISGVGAIAIANAATISTYKDAQTTQLQDIKNRLVRIERKIDAAYMTRTKHSGD